MNEKSLETLEAWSKSKDFRLRIYREVLPLLPPEEKWNLNQQLIRAASSIPANLAEGYRRFYYQDNVRFCYNARGSLQETLSHLIIAKEVRCIPTPLFDTLQRDVETLMKLINGYIGYLKRSKYGDDEPGARLAIREPAASYDIEDPEPPSMEIEDQKRITDRPDPQ